MKILKTNYMPSYVLLAGWLGDWSYKDSYAVQDKLDNTKKKKRRNKEKLTLPGHSFS